MSMTPLPKRRLLALAIALACSGCGTDQGLKVTAAPDGGTGAANPAPRPAPQTPAAPASGRKTALDAANSAKIPAVSLAPNIRPDAQCKTPEESYDFTGVITARYGAEGALRLQKLLASDFKDSSLTAQDRKMLNTLAREMLWIPAPVEERIGSMMFTFGNRDLQTLPRGDGNEEFWDGTGQLISRLLAAAPKTPFETRLILVEKGDPGSLAGGLVLLDSQTVKSVFDDPKNAGLTKLNFVLAHELAHIYKRHRAKRIQQLMVDSEAGLKLTRLIFSSVKQGTPDLSNAKAYLQMAMLMPEVVDLVRKNNAKYEQDQEFEADGCATSLMLSAAIGDPLAGFRAYRQDQRDQNKLAGEGKWDPYVSHPPNEAREKNIQTRMTVVMAQTAKDQAALRIEPAAGPARRANAAKPPAAPANAASAPNAKRK